MGDLFFPSTHHNACTLFNMIHEKTEIKETYLDGGAAETTAVTAETVPVWSSRNEEAPARPDCHSPAAAPEKDVKFWETTLSLVLFLYFLQIKVALLITELELFYIRVKFCTQNSLWNYLELIIDCTQYDK